MHNMQNHDYLGMQMNEFRLKSGFALPDMRLFSKFAPAKTQKNFDDR